MKIGELTGGQAIQEGSDVLKKKTSVGSSEFQDLLTEELNTKTGSEKDSGIALEGIDPMNIPVSMYPQWNGSVHADNTVGGGMTAEAVLSLSANLDAIERSIGDSKGNLKTIDRMLESLSREAEGFEKNIASLSDEHPLRQLGEQLSVLAYVESVKWKRGDYS
jgi:hypothetical protein